MNKYLEKLISPEDKAIAEKRLLKTIDMMPTPVVRTNLDVGELNLFRVFLDANDMPAYVIGYYTSYENHHFSHMGNYGMNLLCYSIANSSYEAECSRMHMVMKYGSVEKAYNLYRQEIFKIREMGIL